MTLYNITFNLDDTRDILHPCVPLTTGDGEDRITKRVCLADSIEHCMQALPHCHRNIASGTRFLVREVQIDECDEALISPHILKEENLVPDALENNEYWYTKPIKFDVHEYEIKHCDYDYELAFTCISRKQCLIIVSQYAPADEFEKYNSSQEIYKAFCKYANQRKMWSEMDDVWENLAMLPWAQKTRIYNLEIKPIDYELEEMER